MPQTSDSMNATAFPSTGAESAINLDSFDMDQSWMFPGTNVDWVRKTANEKDNPFPSDSRHSLPHADETKT